MNMTSFKAAVCSRRNWIALFAAAAVAGCGGGTSANNLDEGNNSGNDSGKLEVLATVNMVGDLVRQVGGDLVNVTELMGPGVDPHQYQPTQGDSVKIDKAKLIFYVGLHLEGKIQATLEKIDGEEGRSAIAVTKDVPKDKLMDDPEEQGSDYHDPHIWFDVTLWSMTVDSVVAGLSAADPENKAKYEANGKVAKTKMAELHNWSKSKVEELAPEKRILVTSHDAYNYFAKAYGFDVKALQGISTVGEAGVADVTKMVDFIKEQKVKAIFVESSVNPDAIERIAQDAGVVVGGELFSDAMGERGKMEHGLDVGTYEGMIKHNLNTIVKALK